MNIYSRFYFNAPEANLELLLIQNKQGNVSMIYTTVAPVSKPLFSKWKAKMEKFIVKN